MLHLKFTKKAVGDLTGIWNYTLESSSKNQANRYYNFLVLSCQEILQKSQLGKEYHVIDPNLFGVKIFHHLVLFRIINDKAIEVTRIIDYRMHLKN